VGQRRAHRGARRSITALVTAPRLIAHSRVIGAVEKRQRYGLD